MAFVLNTHRTYKQKATLSFLMEDGKTQEAPIVVTWKSIPKSEAKGDDRDLLDVVLVNVEGISFTDDKGDPVDTLEAIKNDAACAIQLIEIWREGLEKNSRKRT